MRLAPVASVAFALLTATATAQPAGQWALCGAPLLPPVEGDPALRDDPDTPVDIDARRSQTRGDPPVYRFEGDVVVRRADQTFRSERIRYDTAKQRLDAEGGIELREQGLLVSAERARYWLDDDRGRFEGVGEYRLATGHLQGSAASIERTDRVRSRYHRVSLSTCMPGNEFWTLQAREARLNTRTRQGKARHAVLSLGSLPVFYTPYLQFPLGDERLTGFLAPTIEQSQRNGSTIALPWYWNIAPNYDATFTPTSYWKRGLLADAEFRYLEPALSGEVSGSYLPDDDRFGDDRWAINQDHRLHIGNAWRGRLIQQRTSDTAFSDHFGDEFDYRSASFLESQAALSWAENGWLASVDAQSWQRVEADARSPYARRPRLQLGYQPTRRLGPLAFDAAAEWTDFYNDDPATEQGVEYHFSPRLSLPLRTLAYRFEPAIAWQHTGYDLENSDRSDPEPSVSVPIVTADARLYLERPETLFDGVYQTLEPRVFYRNVPDRDQDELPSFSTSSSDGTFSRLFRSTAFGIDHTEQVSLGLTTRYRDQASGRTYLRAAAGQVFYLHDDAPRDRSDYVTELRLSLPSGYTAELDYRWDPEQSGNSELRSRLRWQGSADQILNLGLRQREVDGQTTLNQAELSLALQLRPDLRVFAGWLEDLDTHRNRQEFIGLEQSGCCHAWRIVMEDRLQRATADTPQVERTFMIELELRGLGGIGDRIRPFLRDEIDGYDPGF
ncbi:LPS assembly protein LptD [Spiribacter sp. 218]|jgi:LPS-assembly protein